MNKPYIHGMLPDVAANAKAPPTAAEQPQIRYLGDMQRLQPQPGDVFVLSCEQAISEETADRIHKMVSGILNGAQVLVLGDGMKLGVVGHEMPSHHYVVNNFITGDEAKQIARRRMKDQILRQSDAGET